MKDITNPATSAKSAIAMISSTSVNARRFFLKLRIFFRISFRSKPFFPEKQPSSTPSRPVFLRFFRFFSAFRPFSYTMKKGKSRFLYQTPLFFSNARFVQLRRMEYCTSPYIGPFRAPRAEQRLIYFIPCFRRLCSFRAGC